MNEATLLFADGSAYGLPDGISVTHTLAILAMMGVVTVLLRQAPFTAMKLLKGNTLVGMLGVTMPVGVMVVLVVYTVRSQATMPGGWIASGIAAAVTLAIHMWRRSVGWSILIGTVCYIGLINWVF